MKKKYKVIQISEGFWSTLLFGSSKVPINKMEIELNTLGNDGWQVVFQLIEKKRMLLFWVRESVIITLEKSGIID